MLRTFCVAMYCTSGASQAFADKTLPRFAFFLKEKDTFYTRAFLCSTPTLQCDFLCGAGMHSVAARLPGSLSAMNDHYILKLVQAFYLLPL